jgi:hypothetical protein
MSSRFGAVFSATLALVLLALYCSSALYLIYQIYPLGNGCMKPTGYEGGYIYVLTTVGGLVSALVIAQLSITKPGSTPTIGGTKPESNLGIYATNTVVGIYLFAWVFTGIAALVVGVMICPEGNKTITDLGTTWLGLAVTAAYAYFGIQPTETKNDKLDAKSTPAESIEARLQQALDQGKITFEPGKAYLREQLLRKNSAPLITPRLQSLVLALATLSQDPIRISELLQTTGDDDHVNGRAVAIGNEEIAARLLPSVTTAEQVTKLGISKIIFDAAVAGQVDRNIWNFDFGVPHPYDDATLGAHRTDIYFAVAA